MPQLVKKYNGIISSDQRGLISYRYHKITRAINIAFWNIDNDTKNSLYVGSYGRNTAINTGDIDILVSLPRDLFDQMSNNRGNVQSHLLSSVRTAIKTTYPNSDVRADGQVIKINFSDGMRFEILPAFEKPAYFMSSPVGYDYPDSNMGGNWMATNPKAEQNAISIKNNETNGLYRATCRHIRFIRDTYFSSYHLPGIVIDSFVYAAIGTWQFSKSNDSSTATAAGTYEKMLLEYFTTHPTYQLMAPGSEQAVSTILSRDYLEKVLKKIAL
ncbi:nucleotidyltransferase [Latilactobacillus curvatus]|uniref:SMODS domain-containing nucleotidyltransferase n=1 Tax=Latilactobacillus curvatus TaxID=28038 RepID=UPI0022F3F608|nr:nucleotidyltransferase [Latilactobacillus curvatus]WBY48590.1 nucleotidyltransferase [Latilactobacillus curvatus]